MTKTNCWVKKQKKKKGKPRLSVTREWIYYKKVTRDALRVHLGRGITLGEQEATMEVLVKHSDCVGADDMDLEACKWM